MGWFTRGKTIMLLSSNFRPPKKPTEAKNQYFPFHGTYTYKRYKNYPLFVAVALNESFIQLLPACKMMDWEANDMSNPFLDPIKVVCSNLIFVRIMLGLQQPGMVFHQTSNTKPSPPESWPEHHRKCYKLEQSGGQWQMERIFLPPWSFHRNLAQGSGWGTVVWLEEKKL